MTVKYDLNDIVQELITCNEQLRDEESYTEYQRIEKRIIELEQLIKERYM